MASYNDVTRLIDELTSIEKARLIEYIGAALRHELDVATQQPSDWHEFLNATYGSLADVPLERPPQGKIPLGEPVE